MIHHGDALEWLRSLAALQEGLRFAGCDQSLEYVAIARARLAAAVPTQTALPLEVPAHG